MLLFVANKFNYTLRSMERKKKKNKKYNYINLNLRKKKEKLLDIFFRPLELLPFYACSMPLMVPVCPCTGKGLFILSTQWFFWQPHDSREDIIHLNDFLISLNFFSIIRFKRSILEIQVGMICVWYFSKVSIIKGDKNIFGIYIFELIHYQKTGKNQRNYRRNFFVGNYYRRK